MSTRDKEPKAEGAKKNEPERDAASGTQEHSTSRRPAGRGPLRDQLSQMWQDISAPRGPGDRATSNAVQDNTDGASGGSPKADEGSAPRAIDAAGPAIKNDVSKKGPDVSKDVSARSDKPDVSPKAFSNAAGNVARAPSTPVKPAGSGLVGDAKPPVSPAAKPPIAGTPPKVQSPAPAGLKAPAPPATAPTPLRADGASKIAAPAPASGKAAGALAAATSQHERLAAFFTEARAAVVGKCTSQQAEVLAAGATRYQQLRSAIQQRGHAGAAEFAAARANLAIVVGTQQALARSEATQAANRLREDCEHQQRAAVDAAAAEGARMHTDAKEQGARISGSVIGANQTVHVAVNRSLASADKLTDQDDRAEVKQAVLSTSSEIRETLVDQGLADKDMLVGKADERAQAIQDDARTMFADRADKVTEIIEGVESMGAPLAERFGTQAAEQLEAIASAERDLAARLSHLDAGAAEIIKISGEGVRRIAQSGQKQLAALDASHAGATSSLSRTTNTAVEELERADATASQLKNGNAFVAGELAKLGSAQMAEARQAHTTNLLGLDAIAGRLSTALEEKTAASTAKIDGATAKITQTLLDGATTLATQCQTERAIAQTNYLAVFAQLSGPSWAKVEEARTHWRSDADKFAADARIAADTATSQHAKVVAELPAKLAEVERATLEKQHAGWFSRHIGAIWSGIKSFVIGLVIGIAAVAFLVVLGVGAAIAIAIVAVVAAVYAIYQRLKILTSQWGNWSLGGEILGVLGSVFAGIGDVVGLTGLIEGIFGTEAVTGRDLDSNERTEKITIGFLSAITFGIAKAFARGRGSRGAGPKSQKLLTDGSEASTPKTNDTTGGESNESSSTKNEGKGDGKTDETKKPDEPKEAKKDEPKPGEPKQEAKKDEPKPGEPKQEAKKDEPKPDEAKGTGKEAAGKETAKETGKETGEETGEKEVGKEEEKPDATEETQPKKRTRPRGGYDGGTKWPPPEPGTRPADPAARTEWRYKRYAYEQAQKGKVASELMSRAEYEKSGYATAAEEGKRPGRGGGADQQATKARIAREEGVELTENTKVGDREKPAYRGGGREGNFVDGKRPNADGGVDLIEVDHIGQRGKPSARYRHKLAAQIRALGPHDTIELIDSKDPTRRIKYTSADVPDADKVVSERSAPKAPRKPSSKKTEAKSPEVVPPNSEGPPKQSTDDESE